MGVGSKKGTQVVKKKGKVSNKQRALKRAARINRIVEMKRRNKRAKKARIVPYKKKQQAIAQSELVEAQEPVFRDTATNQELNILKLLNLAPSTEGQTKPSNYMETLESHLEKKLQQLDQANLENPEVRRVYTEIGQIFSTYRSGKVPKAFKIIPNLVKWREVLDITRPESWTPQAMSQATNIFASNFDSERAQIFYTEYLMPAVKLDLSKNKKLNYHYFQSLRKAIYKPNAWFQAVVLATCIGQATSREIQIIEALLKQMSIPPLSSAVSLIKMAQMPYKPATIHFIRTLIEKKYKLPRKVVDNLSQYFLNFLKWEGQTLPVIWQQALLSFCAQYSSSFDEMLKSSLKSLSAQHRHHLITPEIAKYLN